MSNVSDAFMPIIGAVLSASGPPAGSVAAALAQVALAADPPAAAAGAKPDVLRADPKGPLDLGAALTAYLAGLAACGDGACVQVSLAYFTDAMKGIGVRTTSVALTAGGSLELPVIGSAGDQALDPKTLLALWYSNSQASRWDKLPKSCRGAGAPGALLCRRP